MMKITKIIKAVSSALAAPSIETKAEEPKKEDTKPEVASSTPEKVDIKKTKISTAYKVACPHCSGEFELEDYDPTYKNSEEEVEEKKMEDKVPEEKKAEDKKEEPAKEEKKAEDKPEEKKAEDKSEDKPEDKPVAKKACLPSVDEWKLAAFGTKPAPKMNAFRKTVEDQFLTINLK
jgi:hypothetical protein